TVSCVGTADKLEATVIPAAGLELDFIPRVPMPRSLTLDVLRLPRRLGGAVATTRQILQKRNADVVIGFGGFVSTPAYLAAVSLGVPVIIHEQNALPGLANKLGSRFAKKVCVTYPNTPLREAQHVGLPLRRAIAELDRGQSRAAARSALGLIGDRPTVLVSGGSLGAQSINHATQEATAQILSQGYDIIHVWGAKNFTSDVVPIADSETGATYLPLAYAEAMEQTYAAADFMVGRAGSNTVCETAAVGLPQLYIPLPHGNGEQALNAKAFVEAGAGVIIEDAALNGELLAQQVTSFLSDPARLAQMAQAGVALVPPDAARVIAQLAVSEGGHHAT
ncbi:MAG: UDP-N-acetylglucosamine--N-acetylmuramyl-(pentapeptide) pyrophosphoryl-undecaprenol N-acetylglucosamine transferase, partial [Propionibacteriaceae bacterium]